MPLDGLTLGFMARELHDKLAGGRIDKVTQPFHDMLVLLIRNQGENHRLLIAAGPTYTRMHLTQNTYENPQQAPMFLMLMRKHIQGGRILGITQLNGDRLLRIDISALSEMGDPQEKAFYFEAMGRHTNLTLVQNGVIIDAIRHITDDMSRVRTMLPGLPFDMPPAQDKLSPDALTPDALLARFQSQQGRLDKLLADTISGLSAVSAREIAYRLTGQETPLLQQIDNLPLFCHRLADLMLALPGIYAPCLIRGEDGVPMEAFPFPFLTRQGARLESMPTLSQAIDTLYFEKDRHDRMTQRAGALRRTLQNARSRAENRIAAQQDELNAAQHMEGYRVAGELLTAFGHQVDKGADKTELPNYYDNNNPLSIALDPALSAAQNAQKYFKKYRKANVARRMAGEQIEKAQEDLRLIEDALYFLEEAGGSEDLREIRQPLYDSGLLKIPSQDKKNKKPLKAAPLRFTAGDGTAISVGRSSAQNELLLKTAQGEDVWLHAKDMPGSHVIIHAQGRPVADDTLRQAARLAAWYSKGHGVSVPVDYTLRRYVKKTPGAPAGFVTFTNNKTLLMNTTREQAERTGQTE